MFLKHVWSVFREVFQNGIIRLCIHMQFWCVYVQCAETQCAETLFVCVFKWLWNASKCEQDKKNPAIVNAPAPQLEPSLHCINFLALHPHHDYVNGVHYSHTDCKKEHFIDNVDRKKIIMNESCLRFLHFCCRCDQPWKGDFGFCRCTTVASWCQLHHEHHPSNSHKNEWDTRYLLHPNGQLLAREQE